MKINLKSLCPEGLICKDEKDDKSNHNTEQKLHSFIIHNQTDECSFIISSTELSYENT